MYKRLTLDKLRGVNTNFFSNLRGLVERHRHTYFKEFIDVALSKGKRHYFFEANSPVFRFMELENKTYRFIDEREKIELVVDHEELNRMHSFIGDIYKVKQLATKEGISEVMFREFQEGDYCHILEKPYIVYDIETTFDGYDFRNQYFEMAYTIQTDDDHSEDLLFKYVDRGSMKKLCDYLLSFDGWIIGYNQISFDNPVLVRNVGYGDNELRILNEKSIDPFLIFWKLLGKRMSLDAVASILIAEGKTLSSGKEGEQLLQMYKETGEQKFLNKVKKYCKNDVRITLGVMLYLLKHQEVFLDGQAHIVTIDDLYHLGQPKKEQQSKDQQIHRLVS